MDSPLMGINVDLVIRDKVMAYMLFPLAWFAQRFALTWSYQAQYNEFSFENFTQDLAILTKVIDKSMMIIKFRILSF